MQSIASLQASAQSISRFSNPSKIFRGPLQIHGLLLGLILLFSTFSTAGFSQDAPQKPARVDQPLLLSQVANVETLEKHGRTLFEKCERPDMIPAMEMWLKNDLKELKGVDRTRPLGMMMYLGDILTEPMWAATFIPVTNVDEFLGWMCSMPPTPGTFQKVEGSADRWKVSFGDNANVHVVSRGNYLIMVGEAEQADRNFPDPGPLCEPFATRYDASFSGLLKNIPIGLKSVFLEFAKTTLRADLQQRDNEPAESYRLRRASGESVIKQFERMVSDAEEVTIGARLNRETMVATIELEVVGTPESKLVKAFSAFPGRHSQFGALLDRETTLTVGVSTILEPEQQTLLQQVWTTAEQVLKKEIEKSIAAGKPGAPTDIDAFQPLFGALQRSTQAGLVDVFVQMIGAERSQYEVVGGFRLPGGEEFPLALQKLVQLIKDRQPDNDRLQKLELDVARINDFPVHRATLDPNGANRRLYGEDGGELAFLATPEAIWFAAASKGQAIAALRKTIDEAAKPADDATRPERAPILVTAEISRWVDLIDRRGRAVETFKEESAIAFKGTGHQVRFRMKPSGDALKLQLEFDDGLVKLFGRLIARSQLGNEL
ncbi:hypothetical protein [Planctopirus hydrillae]|nr:hypothetical protein [Planctopirus hydrillae]